MREFKIYEEQNLSIVEDHSLVHSHFSVAKPA